MTLTSFLNNLESYGFLPNPNPKVTNWYEASRNRRCIFVGIMSEDTYNDGHAIINVCTLDNRNDDECEKKYTTFAGAWKAIERIFSNNNPF